MAKNSAWLLGATLLNRIVGFILVITISRILGFESLGAYSLSLVAYMLAKKLGQMNIDRLLIREIRKDPSRRSEFVSAGVLSMILLSIPFVIILNLLVVVLGYSIEIRSYVLILSLALPFDLAISTLDAAFLENDVPKIIGLGSAIMTFVRVGLSFYLLLVGFPLSAVFWSYLAAVIITFAFKIYQGSSNFGFSKPSTDTFKHILGKELISFLAITFASTGFHSLGLLSLGRLAPLYEVGIYSAAFYVFSISTMVVNQVVLGTYPSVSTAAHFGTSRLKEWGLGIVASFIIVITPIIFVGGFLANIIMPVLLGEELLGANVIIWLLLLATIPASIESLLANILFASEQQYIPLISDVIGLTISFLLYVLLIPVFGAMGAALGFLISYTFISISTVIIGYRQNINQRATKVIGVWLISVCIGFLIFIVASFANLLMIWKIIIVVISYGLVIVYSRIVPNSLKSFLISPNKFSA